MRKEILERLSAVCETRQVSVQEGLSESPFEEEVYMRLAQKIGAQRIVQQYKTDGFRIDIVIKCKQTDLPFIAIECDGATYHSSNEAYAWDLFRQEQLEQQGFIFHRIWSTNWWNNADKELDKLVRFIEKKELETLVHFIEKKELEKQT